MKIIKIAGINILIVIFCLFIVEFITYKRQLTVEQNLIALEYKGFFFNSFVSPLKKFKKAIVLAENNNSTSKRIWFRTLDDKYDKYINKKRKSILLFGCSFAVGVGLEDNKTFEYFLQKNTKRKVYNRALAGYGIQHMLYIVRNNLNILKNKKDFIPPEYAIYLFIENHIKRLYRPNDYFDLYLMFYKWNKNKTDLVEFSEKDILYWHSYYLRNIYLSNYDKFFNYTYNGEIMLTDETADYTTMFFIQAYRELKKHFPDIKYIILVYDGERCMNIIKDKLEKEGIKIVYLSELSKINFKEKKYLQDDMSHPNDKVWKIITPLFIKKARI